jgi:AcrR family transcriptional regulator
MVGVKGQVQQRGIERRQAILEAAIDVFARNGFRGSAVNEIGQQAGISGTGVLHHFGSKAKLLFAVIQERDRRAELEFRELAGTGGIEMLRGLMRYARQGVAEPGLNALHSVLLVEGLGQDSLTHDYFLNRMRRIIKWIAEGLERGKETGEIRTDLDSHATAAAIVAFQEGASLVSQLDSKLSIVELYESYLTELISSIEIAPNKD